MVGNWECSGVGYLAVRHSNWSFLFDIYGRCSLWRENIPISVSFPWPLLLQTCLKVFTALVTDTVVFSPTLFVGTSEHKILCFIVISDLEADNNYFQRIKRVYLGKCSQLGVTACQSRSSLNVLSRFSAYQERADFPCSKGVQWKKYLNLLDRCVKWLILCIFTTFLFP